MKQLRSDAGQVIVTWACNFVNHHISSYIRETDFKFGRQLELLEINPLEAYPQVP